MLWNVFPALQKASDSGHGLWFAQIKLIYNTLCREMETFLSRALRQCANNNMRHFYRVPTFDLMIIQGKWSHLSNICLIWVFRYEIVDIHDIDSS